MEVKNKSNYYFIIYLLITIIITICMLGITYIFIKKAYLLSGIYFSISNIISYILIYYFIKKDNNKLIKNCEKINSKGIIDYEYYRDCFLNYSPAVISFIMKDKISRDGIDATLINLINNKIIKITKDGILILNKDYIFKDSEKYIIDNYPLIIKYYVNRRLHDVFQNHVLRNYRNVVLQELVNNKLAVLENNEEVTTKTSFNKKAFIFNCILVFGYIIGLIYAVISLFKGNTTPIFIFANPTINLLILIYVVFALINSKYFNFGNKKNVYIKTKEGMQLFINVGGLKKYIKDFSVIPDEKLEKIKLWDNYVIYAIIFNLKGKLDVDTSTTINNYLSKYYNYHNIYLLNLYLFYCKLLLFITLSPYPITLLIDIYKFKFSIPLLSPKIRYLIIFGIVAVICIFFGSLKYDSAIKKNDEKHHKINEGGKYERI